MHGSTYDLGLLRYHHPILPGDPVMPMKRSALFLLPLLGLLAGCPERPEKPRSVEDTVFKDQVRALDKAREVEAQAEQRKREIDQQLERDSGGGQ
jgi:hypothetical protein